MLKHKRKTSSFAATRMVLLSLILFTAMETAAQSGIKIEMNTSLDLNTEEFARDRFPVLRDAGFSTIYDGTFWAWVEKEKGKFDYKNLDLLLTQAHKKRHQGFSQGRRPPAAVVVERKQERTPGI